MACECGAFKVYSAPKDSKFHSDWCPWSPLYTVPNTKVCAGYWELCSNLATNWVQFTWTGPKFYYCDSCMKEADHMSTVGYVRKGLV